MENYILILWKASNLVALPSCSWGNFKNLIPVSVTLGFSSKVQIGWTTADRAWSMNAARTGCGLWTWPALSQTPEQQQHAWGKTLQNHFSVWKLPIPNDQGHAGDKPCQHQPPAGGGHSPTKGCFALYPVQNSDSGDGLPHSHRAAFLQALPMHMEGANLPGLETRLQTWPSSTARPVLTERLFYMAIRTAISTAVWKAPKSMMCVSKPNDSWQCCAAAHSFFYMV